MNNLKNLMARCKCGVYLSLNEHRDYYASAEERLKELSSFGPLEVPEEVLKKMIETNTIIDLYFYPDTPVSFYKILHYDIVEALKIALEILEERGES